MKIPFPFSAIVGQDEMKLAMILTAIDPAIGGVLVFGDRGTGKSTAVRALAALLPPITAIDGCPVNSAQIADVPDWAHVDGDDRVERPTPVVDLPLGVTEDRVTGALDIERALTKGEKAFQPGLLARANRGYLYIDEVNLLEDHIVDLLLDVAQSGQNVVEREGLSIRHPARFVLVGSGNPEEGELRPQLLDRFGLSVDVASPTDIDERIEVIRRRDAYETDHAAFMLRWQAEDAAIRDRIVTARTALADMVVPEQTLHAGGRIMRRAGIRRPAGRVDAAQGGARACRVARPHRTANRRRQGCRRDGVAAQASSRSAGRCRQRRPRRPRSGGGPWLTFPTHRPVWGLP